MQRPIKLSMVFRDKREAHHSIEKLFASIVSEFGDACEVTRVVMPHQPSGLIPILRNIFYARKHVKGQVIHVTGDAQYLVPFLPWRKVVLTIHDCGYLAKLVGLKRWIYKMVWLQIPCLLARRVTVISESTKEVLQGIVGKIDPQKLVVIENCITIKPCEGVLKKDNDKPVIMQIGSGPHKNLDNLIRAVRGMDCLLQIVGRPSQDNLAAMERNNIDFKCEFAVSDSRVMEIYHQSDLLFFASLHEGFGLPILEAQALGVPVITSNRYSMPAVAGDGALIVEPESPEEIRAAIDCIIKRDEIRKKLVREGMNNVERFSPNATAKKYFKVYSEIAAS